MTSTVDRIFDLFEKSGSGAYLGESVTQTEHALQSADLAVRSGAAPSLVAAALLHDIGHILESTDYLAERGIDDKHEDAGAEWLEHHFGPDVAMPVRLHVDAKRYLSAREPGYLRCLSPASVTSLHLQGGPMSEAECTQFESSPYFQGAISLRRWDDSAKVPGLPVPALAEYRSILASLARSSV